MKILLRLFIFSITFSISALAQDSKKVFVDSKEVKLLIDSLTSALNRNYVYADKALLYSKVLNTNYKKALYNKTETRSQLLEAIHNDLQRTLSDVHLRIGYFPEAAKELEITNQDSLQNSGRTLRLAQAYERNFYFIKKEILPGNVGYLRWDGFDEFVEQALPVFDSAFRYVSNCKAIIIDMRYNEGGNAEMVSALSNYFFDKKTPLNFIITKNLDTIKRYSNPALTEFKVNQAIYILTSKITNSAAEDFTYGMQQSNHAKIIGETTAGGAHSVHHYSLGQGYVIRMPTRRAYNPFSKSNWEGKGIKPTIYSESDSALSNVLTIEYKQELSKANKPEDKKRWETYLLDVKRGKYLGVPFQKQKNSDAAFAIEINDSIYGPTNVGEGFGAVKEYHVKTIFKDRGAAIFIHEGNSAWYKLTLDHDTLLTFDIIPIDPGDDYDFVFFKCADLNCIENIKSNIVKPDRECHSGFESFNGATGLSNYATQKSIGIGPGPTYASAIQVKAGETYYLLVLYGENYTKAGKVPNGFTLYFHNYWPKKNPIVLKNVTFNSNETVIQTKSFIELNKLIELLKSEKSMCIEVRGHADSEGNEDKNIQLSTSRALAVKNYLISKGIDEKRILSKGFGSSQPLSANNTLEGKLKNRRVEYVIIMK